MHRDYDGPRLFDGDHAPTGHAKNRNGLYHANTMPRLEQWQYCDALKYRALIADLEKRDKIEREVGEYLRDADGYGFRRRYRRYTRKERGNLRRAKEYDKSGKTDLGKYPEGMYHFVLNKISRL